MVIAWLISQAVPRAIYQVKKMSKITPDQPMEEFAAPDEEGFRSYYFFRQMEAMAKDNVRNGKPFDFALAKNKFGEINFNEMFGLFKVLKAIEYAKGYTPILDKPVE